MYSSLVKFMKNLFLPTDLLWKTENSKAFIYLRVRAIIFLKNELCEWKPSISFILSAENLEKCS